MAKGSGGGSGPTVAKAYVAIIPTTKDAQKNISKSLIPEMESVSEEAGEKGGKSLVGSLSSALSSGVSKVAAAAKVAAGAGVAALGALTTAAYGAFSDWEQLSGGVQTIFGDAAAETVIANAKRAFGTVQMSANDYLSTVTTFSASLIQSLGGDTDAAAGVADKAITDMADNANKMGTSMESLQYAYQGFSRGTFTMLDNLRLGYGGTQAEMLRLVHDAGVVDESITDISQVSFADMIEGIHIIQQNMGIAGASAQEAATTIEGSFNMMTASWQNLLVAFGEGTPDAIKPAVDNLIQSVGTWLRNAIPRVGIILSGIVSYLPTLASDIIAALPGFVSSIGDALMTSLGELDMTSIMGGMMDTAMENGIVASIVAFAGRVGAAFTSVFGDVDLGATLDEIRGILADIMSGIAAGASIASEVIIGLIDSIDTATLESIMASLRTGGEVILSVLGQIGEMVMGIVVNTLIPAAIAIGNFIQEHIIPGLVHLYEVARPGAEMMVSIISQIWGWVVQLVSALAEFLGPAIAVVLEIAGPVFDALIVGLGDILTAIFGAIGDIWSVVSPFVDKIVDTLSEMFQVLGVLIRAAWPIVADVCKTIGESIGILVSVITSMISGLVDGIGKIIAGVLGIFTSIANLVMGVLNGDIELVKDSFIGLVASIGNIVWGIADILLSPFRFAIGEIRKLWNSTIGRMSFTVPSWIPGIGGNSFSVPKLADGGILTAGGTVLVGEAGPELLTLPAGARVDPLSSATAAPSSYQVIVGDVDLTDDDQVRRVTREYLEFLARIALPAGR